MEELNLPQDENELEAKIKEARSYKNGSKGMLALSVGLLIPIIIKAGLGTWPETRELDNFWNLYGCFAGLGSGTALLFGTIGYMIGRDYQEYYQYIKDNSDIQSNLF
jgi:hypothetical protein